MIWIDLIWFDVIWYVICDIQHIQITCQDSFPAHPLAFSDGILEFSEAPGREVASSWEKFGFGAWKWWENHGKLPWIHWLKIYFYLWEWSKHGHRLLVKSWFSDPSRFKKETAIECLQHMVNFTPAPQSSKVVFKICCPGPSKNCNSSPFRSTQHQAFMKGGRRSLSITCGVSDVFRRSCKIPSLGLLKS